MPAVTRNGDSIEHNQQLRAPCDLHIQYAARLGGPQNGGVSFCLQVVQRGRIQIERLPVGKKSVLASRRTNYSTQRILLVPLSNPPKGGSPKEMKPKPVPRRGGDL